MNFIWCLGYARNCLRHNFRSTPLINLFDKQMILLSHFAHRQTARPLDRQTPFRVFEQKKLECQALSSDKHTYYLIKAALSLSSSSSLQLPSNVMQIKVNDSYSSIKPTTKRIMLDITLSSFKKLLHRRHGHPFILIKRKMFFSKQL